uniref:Uncharacterized protein n=1 Tax=Anguilla anguilla TaxID=7936 RepID=A0A0E9XTW8_ANGAN
MSHCVAVEMTEHCDGVIVPDFSFCGGKVSLSGLSCK